MQKVLLHICCSTCAVSCIERLKNEGFSVVGFFYNPNIHPEDEYCARQKDLARIREVGDIEIVEGAYDTERWFARCDSLSQEPEGGARCHVCYEMRLKETEQKCTELDMDCFTTTLTVSPHKDSDVINEIGRRLGKGRFLERNFKKHDGFRRAGELAKQHNLYRQHYCGCVYSMGSTKISK